MSSGKFISGEPTPDRAYYDLMDEFAQQVVGIRYEWAGPPNEMLLYNPKRIHPAEARTSTIVVHEIDDDPLGLEYTIRRIANGNAGLGGVNDIVVGVNSPYSSDGIEQGRRTEVYEGLAGFLTQRFHAERLPLSTVRAVHTFISDRNFNKVFVKCLKTVVTESLLYHRPFNYSIGRIDSDTTGLSKGAVALASTATSQGLARLVKLHTVFGQPRYHTKEHMGSSQAEAIARLYGTTRGYVEEDLLSTEPRSYHEESASWARLKDWVQFLIGLQLIDPEGVSPDGESRLFLRIMDGYPDSEDPDIPPFAYLPHHLAEHHTSYRRIVKLADRYRAYEIPLREAGDEYASYVDMKDKPASGEWRIRNTGRDIRSMIGIVLMRQEVLAGRPIKLAPERIGQLAHMAARCVGRTRGRSDMPLGTWIREVRESAAPYASYFALPAGQTIIQPSRLSAPPLKTDPDAVSPAFTGASSGGR